MPTSVVGASLVGNFALTTDVTAVALSESATIVTLSNQGADDLYWRFTERADLTDAPILAAGDRQTFIFLERGQHRSLFFRAVNTTTNCVVTSDADEGRFVP